MRIVIAGAGEVGSHLAKMLSNEEQDIIIMDVDDDKLSKLDNYNLMTYEGSAISFNELNNVKVGSADLFIAVTPFEARNTLACSMAKKLGVRKTVARIDNDEYFKPSNLPFFTAMGIDDLIYPEQLAADEMAAALQRTWARNWFELFDGELIVVGVKVRQGAQIVGKQLKEIANISSFLHVSAIKRNREIIIPGGDDRVLENDIAYIATTRDHIDEVRAVCGKTHTQVDNVLIVGGTKMAVQLVKQIADKVRVKIIEADYNRCQDLADRFPDCSIVQGDMRNTDLLEEEGISDYDAFIALGDNSEFNILGCIMAKAHGVRKTIAEVEDIQYITEAEALNIGSIVNKKLLASSHIMQIMLDSDETNAKCLALADAEVAEVVVKPGTRVTRHDVRDLKMSHDMTIAGLVRAGKGQLVTGDTRLQAGDHVVVFGLGGAIHKIDKFFN